MPSLVAVPRQIERLDRNGKYLVAALDDLARRALADVVAQSRVVTRVAVTVRTSTFFTRTKIRKLDEPSTDTGVIGAAARRVLDLFDLDRPVRLLGVRLELAPLIQD